MSIQTEHKEVDNIEHIRSQFRVSKRAASHYSFWKRLFDIAISLSILFCCIPLFLILSLLIFFASGGPVFFIQTRTGANNKRFRMVKFRTMSVSKQNEKRHTYYWKEGVPDSFQFKTASDSAITPIGKVLRKYSLDELPQLINVLAGHMSLVGPRPEISSITDLYNSHQMQRLAVKPGITGYAQVNGRSEIRHGQKIEYDLYYIENCGFLMDMQIIAATFKSVIKAKGAY